MESMGVRSFLTFFLFLFTAYVRVLFVWNEFSCQNILTLISHYNEQKEKKKKFSIFAISCGFLNILIMIIHFNSKFLMTDSIVFPILNAALGWFAIFKMKSIAVILVKRLHILYDDMTRVHVSYFYFFSWFKLNWRENLKKKNLLFRYSNSFCFV